MNGQRVCGPESRSARGANLSNSGSTKNCHVANNLVYGQRVAVKIFDIFSAVIVVSEHKDWYLTDQYDESVIRFVQLDPVSQTYGRCSVVDEIDRIQQARP